MDVCKTCGILAGTHACNPLRFTIQEQGKAITALRQQLAEANQRIATMEQALESLRMALDPDDWIGEISMYDFIDQALEKAASICDEMVLYTGLDCAQAIRNLIEKD